TRGELGDSTPVRVHDKDVKQAAVAVARKHDARAVGRPACTVAFVPAGAVREARDSTPVRIHDVDLFVTVLTVALEQDLRAVGGPGGRKITEGVVSQAGDAAPVRVHEEYLVVPVAVIGESDPRAVGRPCAREPALGGELGFSRPNHVDDEYLGAAAVEIRVRDPLAIRRPDRIDAATGVVGDPGDARPVRVHHVDLEVAVAGAVEGDLTVDGFSGGQIEPRSVHPRGERSLGVVTGGEKSPKGEE